MSARDEKAEDAPVYDERGNVRPHGTEGARPMTYAERVDLAKRQRNDEPKGDPKPKGRQSRRAEK